MLYVTVISIYDAEADIHKIRSVKYIRFVYNYIPANEYPWGTGAPRLEQIKPDCRQIQ